MLTDRCGADFKSARLFPRFRQWREGQRLFFFIYFFFLEVHRPPPEEKPANEQKRIPTRSRLIPADHSRHILDLVEFDFT